MKIHFVFFVVVLLQSCSSLSEKDKHTIAAAEAFNACMVGQRYLLTEEFGETRAEQYGTERCRDRIIPVTTQIREQFYNEGKGPEDLRTLDIVTEACREIAKFTMGEMRRYNIRMLIPDNEMYDPTDKNLDAACPLEEMKKYGTIYKSS